MSENGSFYSPWLVHSFEKHDHSYFTHYQTWSQTRQTQCLGELWEKICIWQQGGTTVKQDNRCKTAFFNGSQLLQTWSAFPWSNKIHFLDAWIMLKVSSKYQGPFAKLSEIFKNNQKNAQQNWTVLHSFQLSTEFNCLESLLIFEEFYHFCNWKQAFKVGL